MDNSELPHLTTQADFEKNDEQLFMNFQTPHLTSNANNLSSLSDGYHSPEDEDDDNKRRETDAEREGDGSDRSFPRKAYVKFGVSNRTVLRWHQNRCVDIECLFGFSAFSNSSDRHMAEDLLRFTGQFVCRICNLALAGNRKSVSRHQERNKKHVKILANSGTASVEGIPTSPGVIDLVAFMIDAGRQAGRERQQVDGKKSKPKSSLSSSSLTSSNSDPLPVNTPSLFSSHPSPEEAGDGNPSKFEAESCCSSIPEFHV